MGVTIPSLLALAPAGKLITVAIYGATHSPPTNSALLADELTGQNQGSACFLSFAPSHTFD